MTTKPKIGVVGAGLMGHGIAYLFARAGHPVAVYEPEPAILRTLSARLEAIADLLDDDRAAVRRIEAATDLAFSVGDAGLVVEAAPENVSLKQALFAELERITRPDAILASNTSAIPISVVSETVRDKSRVVGTHFWNPPHLVPLVEVSQIADENLPAVEWVIGLLREAGRHPVHVRQDIPGFIGNRLQHAMKREAIAMVAAGICDAETIDDVVKFGFGSRMGVLGPMEQSDLVGLDLTRNIHETLMPSLDNTPHPHPFLVRKVEEGKLGMKTGEGFRTWTPETAEAVHKRLRETLVAIERARKGKTEAG
ncbi:3-hydroxyacyl-CoA dehydrogenase family protein [Microbaculum sp. FT89]|uniref:3-hydroxyacyl-CoA dehydrogenase family protein n=1 Tax=Microbaculum sp. FT89 TaxID=3447298 RepID=UPI003F536926